MLLTSENCTCLVFRSSLFQTTYQVTFVVMQAQMFVIVFLIEVELVWMYIAGHRISNVVIVLVDVEVRQELSFFGVEGASDQIIGRRRTTGN